MGWEYILRLILFGILHWVLAIMLLHDLINRKKVLGGKKLVWALLIMFIFILGSVLYILCHPAIFFGDEENRR